MVKEKTNTCTRKMLTTNPCIEYKRVMPSCNKKSVLRRGAWTAEEDMILKNYIQKYGEGKWHLLPLKTGLNRCRKSCRLRWLNYLRPNIKRGDFQADEIDLIHRIHRLLGNRWSLIAGRIPGRTANDIKNYWNTHVRSRTKRQNVELKVSEPSQHTMVQVIKPQAHTLSKTFNMYTQIAHHEKANFIASSSANDGFNNAFNVSQQSVLPLAVSDDKIDKHLGDFFEDCEMDMNNEIGWSLPGVTVEGEGLDFAQKEDGVNDLFDFPIDDAMWSLLD